MSELVSRGAEATSNRRHHVDLHLDVAHVSRILGHDRRSVTLDTYTHLFEQAAHAADIGRRTADSEFGSLLEASVSLPTRPRLRIVRTSSQQS